MNHYPFRKTRLWGRDILRAIQKDGLGTLQFWAIALVIGVVAGWATLGFRVAIFALQERIYGESDVQLASVASQLPWYWVLIVDTQPT